MPPGIIGAGDLGKGRQLMNMAFFADASISRVAITCAALVLLAACSRSDAVPKCSDQHVLEQVKGAMVDSINDNNTSFIVQLSDSHTGFDNSIIKDGEISGAVEFKDIRADSYDDKIKKYICKADLSDGDMSVPIIYELQLDDDGKPILRAGLDQVTVRDFNIFTQDVRKHTKSYSDWAAKAANKPKQ